MALPTEERIELAQRLWDSVEAKLDDELFEEIQRREAELDSGNVRTYSHEEVMRSVDDVLRRR
jgi:putative addiction module component (TIGR02574 family)